MARWHRSVIVAFIAAAVVPALFGAIPDRERNALLAIYNSTGGGQWTDSTGWNGAPGTECNWFGVTCDDNQTTVIRLSLGYNKLKGPLPAAIADLTNLTELSLYENELAGPIPAAIGSLSKLQHLELEQNQLTGPIPASFGNLTNLLHLELGNNPIGTALPPELGNLARLQNLYLYNAQLTGTIPTSFNQLREIQVLDINDNALTGSVPELGSLTKLRELILQLNKLTGSIPPSIYTITSLERLHLEGNQLSGGLSSDVARLANLQELILSDNKLTGEIPLQITSMTALRELNLNTNQFSGSIPADVGRLQNLDVFDVGDNQLTGTIPSSVSSMTNIGVLSAYGNKLTGTFPPLTALTKLRYLEFNENQLNGTIPDLRVLTNLVELGLGGNKFTGTIPDMFGSMTKLEIVFLYGNSLTGPLPPSLASSATVDNLYIEDNQLSGPLDIGGMKSLRYADLSRNQFSGPLPDSLYDLTSLVDLRLTGMALSGTISSKIANLAKLDALLIGDNEFSGTIPPQIGALTELTYLQLGANRFTGSIPKEIGNLQKLLELDLSENALSGAIPSELINLKALEDGNSTFGYNRLFTNDAALRAFLNQKSANNEFEQTQTMPPTNAKVTATTDRNATVEWTPIAYQYDEGGYQVSAATTPGGTPVAITTTSSKELSSVVLRGLKPSTTYYISVATVTYPHDTQRNLLVSDGTPTVQAATGAPVLAPAEVIVTATPRGLVQIDGVAQNSDSFDVTNFGDVATALTAYHDQEFFTFSPQTFTLAAGATQTITIQSVKQPEGTYWGWIGFTGNGAAQDLGVSVSLLAAIRPAGTVIADPVTTRVEITGLAGSNSLGTATFRNSGTAELTGIAVADVPWIVPKTDPITIYPGSAANITFTIDRSKRPDENGSLTGNLSLIYVAGTSPSQLTALGTTPSGVSVSTVTVVDSTKPQVAPGTIPPIDVKEVAYFVPAVTLLKQTFGSMVSDLTILNSFGSKPVSDLRLYYTAAAATQTALANVAAIAGNQSVNLANVVANIYGSSEAVGSLQIRTTDWQKLVVAAKLLSLNAGGTYAGDAPVFRSDRSAAAGAQTFLAGVRQGSGLRSVLYLQETSGAAATAHIEALDASGTTLAARDVALNAFAFSAVNDLVTDRTATVVVTTAAASAGRISSYARDTDDATGESWSIVDWSRYYDFRQPDAARLPLAGTASSGGSSTAPARRRAVRPGSGTHGNSIEEDAAGGLPTTQLFLFNPGTTEARARMKYTASSRTYENDVAIAPRQTLSISDAASYTGAPASADATLLLDISRGKIVATSRMSSGAAGTALPVVSASSGLRVGQSQIFSGLEDSAAKTIAAAKAGTYRTTYGFVESGGAPVSVRATLLLSDGRSLVSTVATRQFDLNAGQLVVVPDLVKSIIGADRETRYPDLHNLQLQLDVIDGSGAIVPFVTMTDNATGDSLMRLE